MRRMCDFDACHALGNHTFRCDFGILIRKMLMGVMWKPIKREADL
jgi:hypothetical protein